MDAITETILAIFTIAAGVLIGMLTFLIIVAHLPAY